MSYKSTEIPKNAGGRIEEPICLRCNNTLGFKGLSCKAYPDGIPPEILDNSVDHTKPYKGDHDVQFEAIG